MAKSGCRVRLEEACKMTGWIWRVNDRDFGDTGTGQTLSLGNPG